MSPIPPNTVSLIANDVMDACVAAYGQDGAPNVPARTFITHGIPTVTGEQLTVATLGISTVHPFPLAQLRAVRTNAVGSTGMSIEVWRSCWPTFEASSPVNKTRPSPSTYTEAASALLLDAATIWGWIADQVTQGTLIPSISTIADASDVSISPMIPMGPQGTYVGFKLPIAVKLSVAAA